MSVTFSRRSTFRYLPAAVGGGGGGSDYSGYTPTKFVRSTSSGGSNSNNGNSEATAYATMAFAISQVGAAQVVGVVDALTETLAWGSITGGSTGSANHKKVVAKTDGTVITGTASGTNAAANLTFIGFYWNIGTAEFSIQDSPKMVFQKCGWTGGGGTGSGNVVQIVCGNDQAFHGCYGDGTGGRYVFLAFQCNNVLLNECVARTQDGVWGPAASNPTAAFTVYSSTNVDLINCVAIDCLNQGTGAEWLGGHNFVANVGTQSGITDTQGVVMDLAGANLIGMQFDGSNACSVAVTDCASVRNEYGAVMGTHLTSGSVIPFLRGEYSGNNQDGIADFGGSSASANQVNTAGNGSQNLRGVSGSGNTTAALNMATRLANYKRFGTTYGLLRGEAGWNTPTSENVWDAFPNQDLIRAKFAAISPRGFCGGSYTLTSYVKR